MQPAAGDTAWLRRTLERGIAPTGPSARPSSHRSGRALDTAMLVAPTSATDEACTVGCRSNAKRERHGATINNVTDCANAAATRPTAVRSGPARTSACPPVAGVGRMSPLDDRAEHTKSGEEIASLRHIEPEATRHEQRKRRLENSERKPVDKIDDEHLPESGAAHHLRQIPERHARACGRPVDRLGKPEPRHAGRHERIAAAAQIGAV